PHARPSSLLPARRLRDSLLLTSGREGSTPIIMTKRVMALDGPMLGVAGNNPGQGYSPMAPAWSTSCRVAHLPLTKGVAPVSFQPDLHAGHKGESRAVGAAWRRGCGADRPSA